MKNILAAVKDRFYSPEKPEIKRDSLSVSDIFFAICDKDAFGRYDLVVNCLAVESCYGLNDFGFALYEKLMQKISPEENPKEYLENFIISCKNGQCDKMRTDISTGYSLGNDTRQLALAIYHNLQYINVNYTENTVSADYTEGFLAENGFSDEEISLVKEKFNQLKQQLNKPLACIIWAPAFPFYKDILADFAEYGKVSNVKKRSYGKKEFAKAVRGIYAVDDIAKWKIDKKLKYFADYEKALISFDLLLPYPDFQMNAAGDTPLSRIGAAAKKTIRGKHKDRVKDYIYDILLHTCDNFYQSEYMQDIFEAGDTQSLDETVSV